MARTDFVRNYLHVVTSCVETPLTHTIHGVRPKGSLWLSQSPPGRLVTHMTHMDVGNADNAGAFICPCAPRHLCPEGVRPSLGSGFLLRSTSCMTSRDGGNAKGLSGTILVLAVVVKKNRPGKPRPVLYLTNPSESGLRR